MDHVHINVRDIIVDQFKQRAKKQATTLPFPNLVNEFNSSMPPDLLNIAQSSKMHESQLVRLSKAIPSMIYISIKKALQPAKDKLTGLCSTVDVLESEVGTLIQEVAALTAPRSTSHPTPCEPEATPVQVEAPRSAPDDWWVGYESHSEIVSDEENYHKRPSPPPMHSVYDVNPS
ncbi:hypothetical protein HAX54_037806 [Datura stramonium]|uniref:Uncharacterized protein n=1 Tax=Datura stramonium TaxID=4076 RepID=A0ABS8VIX5_DATST|nr:hypothetical protein [Datura stramonium]